jgi:hypothetical protein
MPMGVNSTRSEVAAVWIAAKPPDHVTGLFYRQPELATKQLELLVEAFPERRRVTALWDVVSEEQFRAAERAAQSMRLALHSLKLENPPYDFDAALRSAVQDEAQMLLLLSTPSFVNQRTRIAELAIKSSAHHEHLQNLR